ncbi:exported hypothetical protein [uncultured Defluviicoccus sp.]|uniref:Uncharacterized protein n=1 Tax=metagenome TaxID=256318 RepID=A0A380TJP0_9ZZZZ|nr:exported hypothetical protein [uncultured Defluviicoccus sp.]
MPRSASLCALPTRATRSATFSFAISCCRAGSVSIATSTAPRNGCASTSILPCGTTGSSAMSSRTSSVTRKSAPPCVPSLAAATSISSRLSPRRSQACAWRTAVSARHGSGSRSSMSCRMRSASASKSSVSPTFSAVAGAADGRRRLSADGSRPRSRIVAVVFHDFCTGGLECPNGIAIGRKLYGETAASRASVYKSCVIKQLALRLLVVQVCQAIDARVVTGANEGFSTKFSTIAVAYRPCPRARCPLARAQPSRA